MNMHLLPARVAPPPAWSLDPQSRYEIDGEAFTFSHTTATGVHEFRRSGDKARELVSVTDIDLQVMHADGRLEIDTGFYGRRKAYLRSTGTDVNLVDVDPVDRERLFFFHYLCVGFERVLGEYKARTRPGKVNLGKKCLEKLLPELRDEIVEAFNPKARSGDALRFMLDLPSPRHFARLIKAHRESMSPAAFLRRYRGTDTRALFADPLELRIRAGKQREYCSRKRPGIAFLHRRYKERIRLLNKWCRKKGRVEMLAVTYNTFAKGIKGFDPFYVCWMREGKEVALRRFSTGTGGFRMFRPLQRVELDSWLVDCQTILSTTEAWEQMTERQQKAAKRARLWATVAMDACTRVVLAIKLHVREADSDIAIEVLELALLDKSGLASDLGAACSWMYCGEIKTALPDNGAPFRGSRFMAATHDAGVELLLPKAGKPQARAHLERFFRTQSVGTMPWFSGRTFSNVVEKGDANPQAEAKLFADDFARNFIANLIDGYHHTPHGGLGGETPHDCWMRLTRTQKPGLPPTAARRRRIFGMEFKRKVRAEGIRFYGFQYNSREVQANYGKEATIRVDRFDLSKIAYWNGVTWYDVDPVLDIPRGLSVYEVERATQEFEARFEARAELHLDYVTASAERMRELSAKGDRLHGIDPLTDRATERERIDRMDRERFQFTIKGEGKSGMASRNARPILDLTRSEPEANGATYDLPVAYALPAPEPRPDRYDPAPKEEAAFPEDPAPASDATRHDDDDDAYANGDDISF